MTRPIAFAILSPASSVHTRPVVVMIRHGCVTMTKASKIGAPHKQRASPGCSCALSGVGGVRRLQGLAALCKIRHSLHPTWRAGAVRGEHERGHGGGCGVGWRWGTRKQGHPRSSVNIMDCTICLYYVQKLQSPAWPWRLCIATLGGCGAHTTHNPAAHHLRCPGTQADLVQPTGKPPPFH